MADGEGRNGVWLAEQGLDVLAIDFSPAALAKARALAQERGVALRTEVADVTKWRWPEAAYDVVVAIFIQVVFPAERTSFFANLKRALKPGGLLLDARLPRGTARISHRRAAGAGTLYTRAPCWRKPSAT